MNCILSGGLDWRFSFPPIRSLAMTRSERSAERERFWRSMVDQQRQAGQTVRAFCREKDISEPSFYAWRRTLKRWAAEPSADATSGAPNGRGTGQGRSARSGHFCQGKPRPVDSRQNRRRATQRGRRAGRSSGEGATGDHHAWRLHAAVRSRHEARDRGLPAGGDRPAPP